jgi:hypothetical protein
VSCVTGVLHHGVWSDLVAEHGLGIALCLPLVSTVIDRLSFALVLGSRVGLKAGLGYVVLIDKVAPYPTQSTIGKYREEI